MPTTAIFGTAVYGDSTYGLVFVDGISSLNFTGLGVLKGSTQLAGLSVATFTVSGRVTSTFFRTGQSSLTLTPTGTIKAQGSLGGESLFLIFLQLLS